MALKLFTGKGHTRTDSTTPELLRFGNDVCRLATPHNALARIVQAMIQTTAEVRTAERIPPATRAAMAETWAGRPGLRLKRACKRAALNRKQAPR